MAMPSVLAELELDVCSLFGPCMSNFFQACGGDWQAKLFKGLGKGFGKGLFKGKGKGKGCGKGVNKTDQRSTPEGNVMEAAMQALLTHPCDAVRSAAEEALESARNHHIAKPQVQRNMDVQQSDSHSEDFDNSTECGWVVANALTEPQASFVGEVAVEEVLAVNFNSSSAGDVTSQWASLLAQFPLMSRAYHFGCVSKNSEDAHITLRFCLLNNGSAPWPSNTAFRIAAGDPCGSESIHVGEVAAGDVTEIKLQLSLSSTQSPRSSWALEIDGQPFGPLLTLDLC